MKSLLFITLFITIVSHDIVQAQQAPPVGSVTEAEIREEYRVFDIYTERYDPDPEAVSMLAAVQDSIVLEVIFGTWCHDSKRVIPALFKTLESASNPFIKVRYTAVSKDKTQPESVFQQWNIEFTPTIIVLQNGAETGRIVENPDLSIEQDLVKILLSGKRVYE